MENAFILKMGISCTVQVVPMAALVPLFMPSNGEQLCNRCCPRHTSLHVDGGVPLSSNCTCRILDIFPGFPMGFHLTPVALGPSEKHFEHSHLGGIQLPGPHLGEARLWVISTCGDHAHACAHKAAVVHADFAEITVPLSFLRSQSSFPFSIREKKYL